MSLELFLDLISPPCRAIFIFAKINKIEFKYYPVDLLQGQHHSKEFEAINILKNVPVLRQGNFVLAESVAILMYLNRKYGNSIFWYPPDIYIRASVDEYLAWQHEGMHTIMEKLTWGKVMIPLITGLELPQEKMDDIMDKVQTNIDLFCDYFLKDKPFLTGQIICLADLLAVMEIMQTVDDDYDIFLDKPKLNEWRQRIEESVGSKLFQDVHRKLRNIKKWDTSILDPSVKERILIMLQNMTK